MTKLRPEGFEPPYPGFRVAEEPELVMALVGVQEHDDGAGSPLAGQVRSSLQRAPGLRGVETFDQVGGTGPGDAVHVTYWAGQQDLDAWLDGDGDGVLAVAPGGPTGTWWEAFAAPPSYFRTSYSTPLHDWGLARGRAREQDDQHAYHGAARDSIAVAEDDGAASPLPALTPRPGPGRDDVVDLQIPEHACFIRTVQGWADASEAEREHFLGDAYLRYLEGVEYLAGHLEDTQCLSVRLVHDHDEGPGRPQAETLAWFRSLADLERWTWSSPTHEAIFNAFGAHAARFAPDVRVLLGHEISVCPPGGGRARYRGCRPDTGLLPVAHALGAAAPATTG